jgi:hypothetical protein
MGLAADQKGLAQRALPSAPAQTSQNVIDPLV